MRGIWKRYCKCSYLSKTKLHSEDLSLQESVRSGRQSKIGNYVLRFMLENDPHLTSREIAEEFGTHHTTIGDHIKSLEFVLKQSVWIQHELTEKNLSDRVRVCSSHLIRHNVEPFLDKLVTISISREKNRTPNKEHHQQQFQNQVYINEKYCFVCGEIAKIQRTTGC